MSESKLETVSLLVDNYQVDDKELANVVEDAELSDTWQRYNLIGDVMREDTTDTIQLDLSAQIADAIAEEPTILAPAPKKTLGETVKAKVVEFVKPAGQFAIAASAAGLMIIGVQTNVAKQEPTAPTQIIQTAPFGGVAQPVSLNYQEQQVNSRAAIAEQQRRFHALLQDHKQQMKFTSVVNENAKNTEEKKVDKQP